MVDKPDSMNDTVSTVMSVLDAFIQMVKEEVPGLEVVYDEGLSYETALRSYRANNALAGRVDNTFPLLAFRRSVLKPSTERGTARRIRISPKTWVSEDKTEVITYTALQAEFDIEFALITDNIATLEKFEVAYLSHQGISREKELIVNLDQLGDWKYYASYDQDLSDKAINVEDNFYKVVSGTVNVRGFFLVLNGTGKLIHSIQSRIHSFVSNHKTDAKQLSSTLIK